MHIDPDLRPSSAPSARRTAAFLVVAVLMLAALMVLIPGAVDDDDGEDGDDEGVTWPWEVPAEVEVISTDTTWDGRAGYLEAPVRVEAGATLTLSGCDLSITLEDLVFWRRPAFRVEEGAGLVLTGTDLSVEGGDLIERCVVGDLNPSGGDPPYMARPVNLEGTTSPVFHVDMRWRGNATPMGVAVLPEGGDGLELLETVEGGDLGPQEWRHVEVPLEGHQGTAPWVVVFPLREPGGLFFLSHATVTDGGSVVPRDAFPTGDPWEDGWHTDSLQSLSYLMETYEHGSHFSRGWEDYWQALIDSEGDVTIETSNVSAPQGLARHGNAYFSKDDLDPSKGCDVLMAASQGGHVRVDGAGLTVDGSEVSFVPVLASDAEVDIADSTVRGDADLVTLVRPSGRVEATVLEGLEPVDGVPFRYVNHRLLWSLAVDGPTGDGRPFAVKNCWFKGGQLALDLNHTEVASEDCTFEGVRELAVWDHDSEGIWEDPFEVNREDGPFWVTSEFRDCWEALYLRTELCEIYYHEDGRDDSELEVYVHTALTEPFAIYEPLQTMLWSFKGNRVNVLNPQELLDTASGVHLAFSSTIARFDTDHGEVAVEVPYDEDRVDITHGEPSPHLYVPQVRVGLWVESASLEDPTSGGLANMTVSLDSSLLLARNVTLNVSAHEGTFAESYDLDTEMRLVTGDLLLDLELPVVAGENVFDVKVTGNTLDEQGNLTKDVVEIGSLDLKLLMLDGNTTAGREFDLTGVHCVLMPPNTTHAQGWRGLAWGWPYDHWLLVSGGENSSLVVRDEEPLLGRSLRVVVQGNVSLDISDLSVNTLTVYNNLDAFSAPYWPASNTVRISNASWSQGYLALMGGDLAMENVESDDHLRVQCYLPSNLTLNNGTIQGWGCQMQVDGCHVSIEDVVAEVMPQGRFVVDMGDGANVSVRNSTFVGTTLALMAHSSDPYAAYHVEVVRCDFATEGAYLYVGPYLLNMDYYDLDAAATLDISGTLWANLFTGEGTGAVLHHGLYGGLYDLNEVMFDARLYALYVPHLQVIHPEGQPPKHGSLEVVGSGRVRHDMPFHIPRAFSLETEVLVDVTADPAGEADPPEVPVLLRQLTSSRYLVMGFEELDLLRDNGEGHYPPAPDLPALVSALSDY